MAKQIAARKAEPIAAEITLLNQEIEGYKEAMADYKRQVSKLITLATIADDVNEELQENQF